MQSGMLDRENKCAKSESWGSCPLVAGACREETGVLGRGRSWSQVLEPCCGLWPLAFMLRLGRLSLSSHLGSELVRFAGLLERARLQPRQVVEELGLAGRLPRRGGRHWSHGQGVVRTAPKVRLSEPQGTAAVIES